MAPLLTEAPPKLLTVAECLARLPIRMSERAFRKAVRDNDCCREHRKQLFLTEEDFAAFLETLTPCATSARRSRRTSIKGAKNGIRAGRIRPRTTPATLFENEVSSARAQIRKLCAKPTATA